MGLQVLTEIGKKEEGESFNTDLMGEQINKDLDDGAFKVILEARESGKGVTIFDEKSDIEDEKWSNFCTAFREEAHHLGGSSQKTAGLLFKPLWPESKPGEYYARRSPRPAVPTQWAQGRYL